MLMCKEITTLEIAKQLNRGQKSKKETENIGKIIINQALRMSQKEI